MLSSDTISCWKRSVVSLHHPKATTCIACLLYISRLIISQPNYRVWMPCHADISSAKISTQIQSAEGGILRGIMGVTGSRAAAEIIAFIVYLQIYDHATSVPLPRHLHTPKPLWRGWFLSSGSPVSAIVATDIQLFLRSESVHFTLCQIANLTGSRWKTDKVMKMRAGVCRPAESQYLGQCANIKCYLKRISGTICC